MRQLFVTTVDSLLVSVDSRFSLSCPVVDSHSLGRSQSRFQERNKNKSRHKQNETVPQAKNVQEKKRMRLKQKLMAHVEGISLDRSGLPGIIMDNDVK